MLYWGNSEGGLVKNRRCKDSARLEILRTVVANKRPCAAWCSPSGSCQPARASWDPPQPAFDHLATVTGSRVFDVASEGQARGHRRLFESFALEKTGNHLRGKNQCWYLHACSVTFIRITFWKRNKPILLLGTYPASEPIGTTFITVWVDCGKAMWRWSVRSKTTPSTGDLSCWQRRVTLLSTKRPLRSASSDFNWAVCWSAGSLTQLFYFCLHQFSTSLRLCFADWDTVLRKKHQLPSTAHRSRISIWRADYFPASAPLPHRYSGIFFFLFTLITPASVWLFSKLCDVLHWLWVILISTPLYLLTFLNENLIHNTSNRHLCWSCTEPIGSNCSGATTISSVRARANHAIRTRYRLQAPRWPYESKSVPVEESIVIGV